MGWPDERTGGRICSRQSKASKGTRRVRAGEECGIQYASANAAIGRGVRREGAGSLYQERAYADRGTDTQHTGSRLVYACPKPQHSGSSKQSVPSSIIRSSNKCKSICVSTTNSAVSTTTGISRKSVRSIRERCRRAKKNSTYHLGQH